MSPPTAHREGAPNPAPSTEIWRSFWFWAGAIAIARIVGLFFADGDLGPDEAQYWTWAKDPAFGYFSKPPMIAWVIAATTGLFGDGEWAVRIAAPLLHTGAAAFMYLTADQLFNRRTALFAGLGWLTLPGVSISSFLMTTDAPLLLFWAGALWMMFRILKRADASPADFAWLGVLIGLGLLSKYAMVYFIAAAAIAALLSASFRAALVRRELALTAIIAAAIFAPNIAWNAANDFQTVAHTAANANWSDNLFKPASLLRFIGGQFLVFGPILFTALVAAAYALIRKRDTRSEIFILLIFTMTPIVIVAMQAFISRAHANWAAAAYPAGILLVSAVLLHKRAVLAKISLALHGAFAVIFLIAMSNFSIFDRIDAARTVKELRGWETLSTQIAARADRYDAILFDDRSMIAEILYYQRASGLEIAALDPNNGVHHHYEAFLAFRPDVHQRNLFVSVLDSDAHVNYRFGNIQRIGIAAAPIGQGASRTFALFEISDYFGPPGVQYTD